jgi:DNA polymerase II large subunit
MTFGEWYEQTAREMDSNIPKELVKDVLVNAIRVALEELLSNPAEAELSIKCVGRFYLNRTRCYKVAATGKNPDQKLVWTIHFKPSNVLKEILNGRRDHRELMIATTIPLYPDYVESGQGRYKKSGGKRQKVGNYRIKYSVHAVETYRTALNKAKREFLKKQLPIDYEDKK